MFHPDFIANFRESSMTYAACVIEDSLMMTIKSGRNMSEN